MKNNKEIVRRLTDEILSGKYRIERLPDDAFDFSNEVQAMYFSKARKALHSEVAYLTMTISQDLRDLEILKKFGLED